MRSITLALCLVAVAAAPAAAQNRREMQMMADIRMLQEQNQQLQVALAALAEALKAINARFDDQAAATRKGFADQSLKIDQFGNELRVVREGVSEASVRIGQLSQEIEAVRLSIPRYPPPGAVPPDPDADPLAAGAVPGAPGDPAQAVPPPLPAGPGITPQRLFETARADYYAGQWDLCVSGFEMYVKTFPRSELTAEAQYHIGECHFMDGQHQDAVAAYNEVIVNHARTDAAANAFYKRGMALERLGQLDRARESFQGAIANFPDSAAARLAKQALDRLNKGRP